LLKSKIERVKVQFFFYGDRVICRVIYVQLLPSSDILLRYVLGQLDKVLYNHYISYLRSLLGGFGQAANSVVISQRNNQKTQKWTTPKQVQIHPSNGQLLSGCRFIQNVAPLSLSHDRRIKIEQANK